jgi:tryptophan halogenase
MVDFKEVNGNIESLTLKDDQVITADIFIDCTGFRGLLNTKPQRVSCEGRLICDTAIAGHIPYQDRDTELNPYVRSEAVDHGWIWNIPVRTRIGSGLVFNRSITDVEEAKDYFVNYWDNRVQKENLKVIDWTPFYNKNNWHGNVVSIGLSAGFIEPLESTGIALIMEGICQLRVNISNYTYDSMAVEMYNSTMVRFFEECIDFVSAHYTVTERDSKFWNIVKETIKPSDRQKMFMSLLQNPNFIMPQGRTPFSFFASANWMGWLIQQGFPVAPRNTPYPKEIIDEYYKVNEKHRHVWSRKHSDEIKRLEDLYNL